MADTPLPRPESERLAALAGGGSLRLAYGLLYRHQDHPPTEDEIALFLQMASSDTRPAVPRVAISAEEKRRKMAKQQKLRPPGADDLI